MNSTATNLDLKNGAVSASMLAKGGQGLQDECKNKYPQGIKVGEVAETAGHGLGCRVVYHLALCQWSDPQATQVFDFYSLLYLISLSFFLISPFLKEAICDKVPLPSVLIVSWHFVQFLTNPVREIVSYHLAVNRHKIKH